MNKEARKKELIEKINKRAVYNMHFISDYSDEGFLNACKEYLELIKDEDVIDKSVVTDIATIIFCLERDLPYLLDNKDALSTLDYLQECLVEWHDTLFNPSKDLLDYIPEDDE